MIKSTIDINQLNIPNGEFGILEFWNANRDLKSGTVVSDRIALLIVNGKIKKLDGKRGVYCKCGSEYTSNDIIKTDWYIKNLKDVDYEDSLLKLPTSLPDGEFTIKDLCNQFNVEHNSRNTSFFNSRLRRLTVSGIVNIVDKHRPGGYVYCKNKSPEKIDASKEQRCVKCGNIAIKGLKLCGKCIPTPIKETSINIKHPDLESSVAGISTDIKCVLSILKSPINVNKTDNSESINIIVDCINKNFDILKNEISCNHEDLDHWIRNLVNVQEKQLALFEQLARKDKTD